MLGEEVVADGGHEVLGRLDLQVVGQHDQALRLQGAVGGAGLAQLGLAVEDRLVGLGTGVAEREHLGDVDAVLVGQTALAVETALAVRSRGQDDGLALQVGQRGDVVLLGVVLGHEEGVGVGRGRHVEQGDAGIGEQVGAIGGQLAAVTGLEGLRLVTVGDAVEVVDDAADVLRHDVDAAGEVGHVGVTGVDELDVGVVALGLEELLVHRGDERRLREALRGDRDRATRRGLLGGGGGGARRRRGLVVGGRVEVVARAGGGGEQGADGQHGEQGAAQLHEGDLPSVSRGRSSARVRSAAQPELHRAAQDGLTGGAPRDRQQSQP
ncbi:unannotated protein [freshwater metagenome]|uniref:Unannotated protein n=1 Tax=freshwater metagenome TaxID=449393 RepID=A0A6J6R010_9ZZZZ